MTLNPMEEVFAQICKGAGAEFVELRDGSVFFRAPESERLLSLYAFSCNIENVKLALKASREGLAYSSRFPQE